MTSMMKTKKKRKEKKLTMDQDHTSTKAYILIEMFVIHSG